jgi:addiction module RelE/StbE family toxin
VKLRWLRSGSAALRRHVDFIAGHNPSAAKQIRRRVRSAVLRLLDFPNSGRVGQVPGTRELVIANLPYVIVYRLTKTEVQIVRVLHSRQDFQ